MGNGCVPATLPPPPKKKKKKHFCFCTSLLARTEIFANSGMSGQEVKLHSVLLDCTTMQVEDYYELSRRLHPLGRPGTVLEVSGSSPGTGCTRVTSVS